MSDVERLDPEVDGPSEESVAVDGDTGADVLRTYLSERDAPCPGCGYNLRGLVGETCPECGIALDLDLKRDGVLPARRGLLLLLLLWLLFAGVSNSVRAWRSIAISGQSAQSWVIATSPARVVHGHEPEYTCGGADASDDDVHGTVDASAAHRSRDGAGRRDRPRRHIDAHGGAGDVQRPACGVQRRSRAGVEVGRSRLVGGFGACGNSGSGSVDRASKAQGESMGVADAAHDWLAGIRRVRRVSRGRVGDGAGVERSAAPERHRSRSDAFGCGQLRRTLAGKRPEAVNRTSRPSDPSRPPATRSGRTVQAAQLQPAAGPNRATNPVLPGCQLQRPTTLTAGATSAQRNGCRRSRR